MIEVSFEPGELPSGTGTSGEVLLMVEGVVEYICLQRLRAIGLHFSVHISVYVTIYNKLGWLSWLERRSHTFV